MAFTQMLTAARTGSPLVIDGGLGTAVESRGVDLGHELWSAALLRDDPDTLAEVHAAFIAADARIITTASYQATPLGFARASIPAEEGRRLIARSVEIAAEAAKTAEHPVLVAGSVGPYGAALGDGSEYTGDYRLTADEFAAFHRPRIEALVSAGADLLAIETQPRLDEIRALTRLADEYGVPAWVSVTLTDPGDRSSATPRLSDGTPLAHLAEAASTSASIEAIGVNCVRPALVAPALNELAAYTDLPLIAYPNSGETYEPEAMSWQDTDEAGTGSWPVGEWTAAGARLIGGCCRTMPADIAALSSRVAGSASARRSGGNAIGT